ncbi:MAG: hypothetical protein ACR2NW_04790 [Thermodesulfobacteriota bacterium]
MSIKIIYLILVSLLLQPILVNAEEKPVEPIPVEVLPVQDFDKLMNCMREKGYDVSEFRKRMYVEKIYNQESVFCGNKNLVKKNNETGVIFAGCFNIKKGWVEKAIKYRDDTCLSMHEILHEYGRQELGDDWYGLEYGNHGHPIWKLINPDVCGCKNE